MANKPTQAPNNPFACGSNAVKMHTVGPCCGVLLAVYSYAVTDQGAKITFTPLTGNDSAELKYYRWTVYDKFGNNAGGVLDLNNPAVAVEVNTSNLSASGDWKVKFAACKQDGTEETGVSYDIEISDIQSNPTGDSTPANYVNVSLLLKLTSTDDAEFTGFPSEGVEITDGSVIDLNDYLAGATQLDNAGSYIFSLEAKKCWYAVTANEPTNPSGDVIASATSEPSYPIGLTNDFVQIWNTITIETGTAGTFSEAVTVALNNEGVQPSLSFTLKTNVSA